MGLAKELTRDTLANIVPIVAEIAATRGVSLKAALGRSTAVGAGGGFFSFVENPDQAAATSMARFLNTGTGAVLSPMFMAAGAGIGRGFSYLRGTRGEQQVGAPDLVPEQSIKEAGAETIEQAAQRGITLSRRSNSRPCSSCSRTKIRRFFFSRNSEVFSRYYRN